MLSDPQQESETEDSEQLVHTDEVIVRVRCLLMVEFILYSITAGLKCPRVSR